MAWQKRHGYGKRSLVETAISRIKLINDGRLTSRTFSSQQNEIAIHIKIANRSMVVARPVSERIRQSNYKAGELSGSLHAPWPFRANLALMLPASARGVAANSVLV